MTIDIFIYLIKTSLAKANKKTGLIRRYINFDDFRNDSCVKN